MENYSKNFLVHLYKMMVKIRLCEESFVEPIIKKEIGCPVHLYTGQEAIAAGVCAALSKKDYVFGTHRSHGHFLAKGGSMNELVAEVYGKKTGCAKGKGGSMHLIDPGKNMMGAVPIVAGTISLAVGGALASHIRKEKRVAVSFFGDGASGEGTIYESLNFAALKQLPIIFVCENNLYSTHMPVTECRPNSDIFHVGEPFNITSLKVEGNDVLKVYKAAKHAVQLCRNAKGPVFLECSTYRLRGHVGPDDNIQGQRTDIRPTNELATWRRKDPISKFENFLLKNSILKKNAIEKIISQQEKEVKKAHLFAQKSTYPHKRELTRDVFQ